MTKYRIYLLDHADHIVWGHDVVCDTDEDALATAKIGLSPAEIAEVWTGTRRVGQVSGNRSV
jgi:hypothetical protein